jgi:hypothetical protein
MQIDKKGMKNLLMNIMLKKYFKKTQIQKKHLSMPFYLGFWPGIP